MIATGRPATFFQILDNGKPVNASASELRYQLKDRLVTLTGKAELKQNDNQVNGDVIRYDIQKQQMIAQSSGKGSRVKTIFLPQEIDEFNKSRQTLILWHFASKRPEKSQRPTSSTKRQPTGSNRASGRPARPEQGR